MVELDAKETYYLKMHTQMFGLFFKFLDQKGKDSCLCALYKTLPHG